MSTFDLTPLFRSTVGFDRLSRLFDSALTEPAAPTYPPYNIEKVSEDDYRVVMAVAGFGEKDIEITVKENTLVVAGKTAQQEQVRYLHRGIAGRSFERRFDLADHIVVKGANLENGLLTIELKREIPEALKPRTIPVSAKSGASIEHKHAA